MNRQISLKGFSLALILVVILVQPGEGLAQRRRVERRERRREAVIGNLPREHTKILVRGHEFFYSRGVFYRTSPRGFVAMPGPVGARLRVLPAGYVTARFRGAPFFLFYGTYYQYDPVGKEYVVVNPPATTPAAAPPILDRIELVDGQSLEGTFVGGTSDSVQIEIGGEVKAFPIEQITSIVFAPPAQ